MWTWWWWQCRWSARYIIFLNDHHPGVVNQIVAFETHEMGMINRSIDLSHGPTYTYDVQSVVNKIHIGVPMYNRNTRYLYTYIHISHAHTHNIYVTSEVYV